MSQSSYERFIRFADIDAAGFVFFANYLALCHEAYEDSLRRAGIELRAFFVAHRVLLPVAKTQAQYLGPLESGNRVRVDLSSSASSESAFRVDYKIFRVAAPEKLVCVAQTEHVALDLGTLERRALPADIARWIGAA